MYKKKIFGLAVCFVALILCVPFKLQAQIVDLEYDNLSIFDISGNYSEDESGIEVEYTLIQDSKGKLTGSGWVYSSDHDLDVDLEIKGKVKGSNGVVTVIYTIKGNGYQQGYQYKSTQKSSLVINKNSLTMAGKTKLKDCLKGWGCENGEFYDSLPLPYGMTGEAELGIDVESDASGKKLEGTGELTLSNGEEYPLYAKGKYNSKNNETKFSLKGVADSTKGIKFKLIINEGSGDVTDIKAKALGQKLIY
jgi:hypothetical protein